MEVENKMLIDDYWPNYETEDNDEKESGWEKFCRMADEEHDEAACLSERGLGHANGYYL